MQGFDNSRASGEEWSVQACPTSEDGPWQIRRTVGPRARFRTDGDAWLFVVGLAEAGSDYHQDALDFIARENPRERAAIQRFVERGRGEPAELALAG